MTLLYFFPKTVIVISIILFVVWNSGSGNSGSCKKQHWIKPYIRKDGTRVEGHWKDK